jgi:hypothetical protein
MLRLTLLLACWLAAGQPSMAALLPFMPAVLNKTEDKERLQSSAACKSMIVVVCFAATTVAGSMTCSVHVYGQL